MFFLHFYNFSHLKYLLALALVLPLVACSSGGTSASSDPGSPSIPSSPSSIGLSWTIPTEREDITPLPIQEIAGFRIYYGTETGVYPNQFDVDDGAADQAQIVDIPSGTYYVVMTTVDTDGRESAYSSEVVVVL